MMRSGMGATSGLHPDRAILQEQAATWNELLHDAGGREDPGLLADFEHWRSTSPEHAAAYDRVERARLLLEGDADSLAMLALRRETLARIASRRGGRRRVLLATCAALLASVVTGFAVSGGDWRGLPESLQDHARYWLHGEVARSTARGERLTLVLEDGSVLTLNTDSRARIRYSDEQRRITLERGQALFEVARDTARPFVVTAGDQEVRALGTAFDVRLSGAQVEVTLLEGRVTVGAAAAAIASDTAVAPHRAPTVLEPGQQLVAHARDLPQLHQPDVQRVVSWRNGQVIFQDDPLASAVEEMNRYARRQVVLADDRLEALRVSGAFDTGNTALFVEALTSYFPIRVVSRQSDHIVLAMD